LLAGAAAAIDNAANAGGDAGKPRRFAELRRPAVAARKNRAGIESLDPVGSRSIEGAATGICICGTEGDGGKPRLKLDIDSAAIVEPAHSQIATETMTVDDLACIVFLDR
jgi:hypothetical protein